jgi:CheY-like chemotaxis protein
LGKGSEFTVRLPALDVDVPASKMQTQSRTDKGAKRKILVVDDNVDAVITITTLLKAWGHEVHGVYNGTSALDAVREFKPDIILLDIGLPGMSGYEVARSLRAEPQAHGIVLAALTGYGQESDRQRSFEAGFDYHLTKPPDPTVLESLLASPRLRVPGAVHSGENN